MVHCEWCGMDVPTGSEGRCFLGHPLPGAPLIAAGSIPTVTSSAHRPVADAIQPAAEVANPPVPSPFAPAALAAAPAAFAPPPSPFAPLVPVEAPAQTSAQAPVEREERSTGFPAPRPLGELVAAAAAAVDADDEAAPPRQLFMPLPVEATAPLAPAAFAPAPISPAPPAASATIPIAPVSGTAALDPSMYQPSGPAPAVVHDLFVISSEKPSRMPPRKALFALGAVVVLIAGYFGLKMAAGGSAAPEQATTVAAPRALRLVRALAPGQTSTYHLKTTVRMTTTVQGQAHATTMIGGLDLTERVLSKNADGTTSLRYTPNHVQLSLDGHAVSIPAGALKPVDVTIDPKGGVRGVAGSAAGAPGADASTLYLAPVLPENVTAGLTWKRVDSQPVPQIGGSITTTALFKVLKLDASSAVVGSDLAGEFSAHLSEAQIRALVGQSPANMTFDMHGRVLGHGTQTVDRKTGQVNAAQEVVSFTMDIAGNGAQIARVAMSMHLDLTRSGAPAAPNVA